LQGAGITAIKNEDKETRHLWDLSCKISNRVFKVEVKLDAMAVRTNNMAIEIENPISSKLTGLNVTEAEIWAVLIREEDNWMVFLTETEKLRSYVKNNKGRRIEKAGDGNATILLYPLPEILTIFSRIDNMITIIDGGIDYSNITKIIKNMIKKKR
jgi:hypothetical protein